MRAILIGAQGTGKTALFCRLTGLPQKEDELPTCGVLQTPYPIQLQGEHGPVLLDLLEISDEPRFMSLYALSSPDFAILVYSRGSRQTMQRATQLISSQLRAHHSHCLPLLFVENRNSDIPVEDEGLAGRITAFISKISKRYRWPLIEVNLKTGEGAEILLEQLYKCAHACSRSQRELHPRSFSSAPWSYLDGVECDPSRAVPRKLFVRQRSWYHQILSWAGIYQWSSPSHQDSSKVFDTLSKDWPFAGAEFPYVPDPDRKYANRTPGGILNGYTEKCVIKATSGAPSELCTLIFLACNTGVRVPRVYQARYAANGGGTLFLECIEGESLKECLESQSWISRLRIYCKLRGIVQEMQRFQCDFPGALDGSPVCHGHVFDNSPLPKPFVSSYDFAAWAIRQQDIERRLRRLRAQSPHIPDDFQLYEPLPPYPFCHYDLDWRNVMMTPRGELALIDFETSGFYDPGLEHVAMRLNCGIGPYASWRYWRQKLRYYRHWLTMWFLFGRYPQAERFHAMVGQALMFNDRRQDLL